MKTIHLKIYIQNPNLKKKKKNIKKRWIKTKTKKNEKNLKFSPENNNF
jgi:hypothetical protein